jgi:hypothetical protein
MCGWRHVAYSPGHVHLNSTRLVHSLLTTFAPPGSRATPLLYACTGAPRHRTMRSRSTPVPVFAARTMVGRSAHRGLAE